MAWATLREEENVESQLLAVIEWRRKVSSWTLVSGTTYKATFDFGHVVGVAQGETDGTEADLTEAASSTLAQGEFFFDIFTNTLYVRTSDDLDPNNKFIVVTYEMHLATHDAAFNRDPLDSTSRVVDFEPIISPQAPEKKQTLSDVLAGRLQDQATSLVLNNADHFLERHLNEASVSQAQIRIYSWLGKLQTDNIQLVIDGKMGPPQYQRTQVRFQVYDPINIFSTEFRNKATAFFNTTDFPSLDLQYDTKPIREVRGVVEGMPAVNIDFEQDAPSSSNNRVWVTQSGQSDRGSVQRTVPASPTSTLTRTYLSSNHGIRVGDSVRINKATPESRTVTAIGSNYIEHATLSSGAAAGSDTVDRSHVGAVFIVQNDILYKAQLGVHYNESNALAGGSIGFTFTSGLDSGGTPLLPAVLSPNDQVYVTAYGKKVDSITLGGSGFGSNSANTGNLTNAVVILYDLLKNYVGITESKLDLPQFQALEASVPDEIGFAIPFDSFSKNPKHKAIIVEILKTPLLRLTLTDENKWTITQTGPQGAERFELGEDELVDGDISIQYSYSEVVSDVNVRYLVREIAEKISNTEEGFLTKSAISLTGRFLHKATNVLDFQSLHILGSQAQTLADRLAYVFGERKARYTFKAKNRLMQTNVVDSIKLTKPVIPDASYDGITEISRKIAVDDTSMGLREITIEGDDQKGIEDNAGGW